MKHRGFQGRELGWNCGRSWGWTREARSAQLLPAFPQAGGHRLVDIFSRIRGILMPLMILLGEHHVSLLVLIYSSLRIRAGLLGPADRDTWPDPEGHCRRPGQDPDHSEVLALSGPRTSHQWPLFQKARSLLYHLSIVAEEPSQFPYFWEEVARNEDST